MVFKETYDIAIIGGGIIGNSIAAHLAEENLKIVIIDPNNLGLAASKAAAGMFQLQLSELGNKELIDFCHESFLYFPRFYEKIKSTQLLENIDMGFRQTGSIYLAFKEAEIKEKENEYNELRVKPELSFLKKEELLNIEPKVSKDIIGGFHYPKEGYINNPRFLKGIISYCQWKNITYLESKVDEIIIDKSNIKSLILQNGQTINAKKYILCNGAWANKLLKKIYNIERNLIVGVKGEILQLNTKNTIPIKKVLLSHDGYIVPRPATNSLENDSIIIGGTTEIVDLEKEGFAFKNTEKGLEILKSILFKLLPSCINLPVINTWAGIRPNTTDSLPILGKSEDIDNLIFAVGHYRNGILMGPYTGMLIKDLIVNNKTLFNIENFKIERFINEKKVLNRSKFSTKLPA